MTVMTIVGARPQFIKAAPVGRALSEAGIQGCTVHTGQHHGVDMSEVFFDELGISAPDYNLGVSGGGHGEMTGAMLQRIEPLLHKVMPWCVLVYGDTNSTLAGALAASKLGIRVAHVEAGLRSFNRRMPEEQNRVLTDHLADLLFAPTDAASSNLRSEGIPDQRVHQIGDVMFDAALLFAARAKGRSDVLRRENVRTGRYVLATVHRAENTDDIDRLRVIVTELDRVAAEIPVLLPLHPRTREALIRTGVWPSTVTCIDPVGYLDMVALETNAAAIATDSGGVQKEAYFYGVPCVTLRDETEWTELIDLGWNRLAPPCEASIASTVLAVIGYVGRRGQPYGDGAAAHRVASILASAL